MKPRPSFVGGHPLPLVRRSPVGDAIPLRICSSLVLVREDSCLEGVLDFGLAEPFSGRFKRTREALFVSALVKLVVCGARIGRQGYQQRPSHTQPRLWVVSEQANPNWTDARVNGALKRSDLP
jgi:hypothetical protein